MSPTHRTPDGDRQVGPTWESLIDRQIREATERGEFDDLPHQGEPLPLEDDTLAGDHAMAYPDAARRGLRAALDRGRQGGSGAPRAA